MRCTAAARSVSVVTLCVWLCVSSNCERPRVIESLRGKEVTYIAAGSSHSACILSNGDLYTWGKGRYGRLGHGDADDQLRPKRVELLRSERVTDVACGSGDAQTLCITAANRNGPGHVWSWGDGDFGKLGRGGSEASTTPLIIDKLDGLNVVKVQCGSQFSAALTQDGALYTWYVLLRCSRQLLSFVRKRSLCRVAGCQMVVSVVLLPSCRFSGIVLMREVFLLMYFNFGGGRGGKLMLSLLLKCVVLLLMTCGSFSLLCVHRCCWGQREMLDASIGCQVKRACLCRSIEMCQGQ